MIYSICFSIFMSINIASIKKKNSNKLYNYRILEIRKCTMYNSTKAKKDNHVMSVQYQNHLIERKNNNIILLTCINIHYTHQ